MCGVGAEVASLAAEKTFGPLRGPVMRLTGPDAPAPASFPLEQAFAPQVSDIIGAVSAITSRQGHRDRAGLVLA